MTKALYYKDQQRSLSMSEPGEALENTFLFFIDENKKIFETSDIQIRAKNEPSLKYFLK